MKKFFANILCGFIPSQEKRRAVRNILLNKNLLTSEAPSGYVVDYNDDIVVIKKVFILILPIYNC